MRVLQIFPNAVGSGGAEAVARIERDTLTDMDHEVAILSAARFGGEIAPSFAAKRGGRLETVVGHIGDIVDPKAGSSAARAARALAPDIVHVHLWQTMSLSAVIRAARAAAAPVAWTLHDHALLCAKAMLIRAGAPCERGLPCEVRSTMLLHRLKRLDVTYIAPSNYIANAHRAAGVPADRLRVLSNPAETTAGTRPRELRRVDVPLRFGFLAQLEYYKGVDRLDELVAFPDVEVIVAGSGSRQLPPRATPLGHVSRADLDARFWDVIDVLVVPSRCPENAPMVVLEAFAHGVPVVAARVGGIPEMVTEGVTGLLLDDWSQRELRSAVDRVRAEYAQMSEAAVDYVSRCDGARAHGEALVRLYEGLLA